ncbi:MAG: hypothetical protein ACM3UY_08500 [Methanocella sp.]|jgi:hypothetical protein
MGCYSDVLPIRRKIKFETAQTIKSATSIIHKLIIPTNVNKKKTVMSTIAIAPTSLRLFRKFWASAILDTDKLEYILPKKYSNQNRNNNPAKWNIRTNNPNYQFRNHIILNNKRGADTYASSKGKTPQNPKHKDNPVNASLFALYAPADSPANPCYSYTNKNIATAKTALKNL